MKGTNRLLAALVVLLAIGNVLQWRARAPEGPEETIQRFAELWAERVGFYDQNRFLGVRTEQNPTDAWVTAEIIHEVEPDFIVEAGTLKGGSALFWAMVLEQVNPDGRVITIDIHHQVTRARKHRLWEEHVESLVGSSTDPDIVAAVRQRVAGGRVLVILDSAHTADHVYGELRAYAPLVDVGSYVIVQDTGLARPSPNETWASEGVRRFLRENDDFVVDRKRERFMITNNPDGYLRRVRQEAEPRPGSTGAASRSEGFAG